jgi:hypothetical protein
MVSVLILGCVIACPVMMGAMMLFMRRGGRSKGRSEREE